MRKALVLSIPGTGTRFTLNYLEACLGYERVPPEHLAKKRPDEGVVGQVHVNHFGPLLRELAGMRGLKTVVPLRHPARQFFARLDPKKPDKTREDTLSFWRELPKLLERHDYVFLPIEGDFDRRARLSLVARHLDAKADQDLLDYLVEHWSPVGTSGLKPERIAYERDGNVTVGDFDLNAALADAVAWYNTAIVEFRANLITTGLATSDSLEPGGYKHGNR